MTLILASTSAIRLQLLHAAGVLVTAVAPRVDEDSIRGALQGEGATPRDIADAVAEMKARKIADKSPGATVLGCDQVLAFEGEVWAKPNSPEHALSQLHRLRGQTHTLISAAVVYQDARPVWRHIGLAHMTMRHASDGYLEGYVSRNWDSIRHSVGGYKLEEEGARLFSKVDGDTFTVLGLPLLPILGYLADRGLIPI